MNQFKTTITNIVGLIILLLSVQAFAWEKDVSYPITILHTNDHHGHFWPNANGEFGLAAQKSLVDSIRKEVAANNGFMLLLSAGDVNTGVPESDLLNAEPDFRAMNLVGYDAMVVGNHEYDNPLSVIRQQEQWAQFPFLSANTYRNGSEQRLFFPYQIFQQKGIKIAVIGLTTDDTMRIGNTNNLQGIDIRSPIKELTKLLPKLKANEAPDMTIALTHMGHYDNGNYGSNAPGDVTLARSVMKGDLDLIIGGHSQDPLCILEKNSKNSRYQPAEPCSPDRQNGIWIVQAHEWGKYVGRADFTFRNGELTLDNYQLIPVNLKKTVAKGQLTESNPYYTDEIPADPQVVELLTPFQKRGEKQLLIKIGSLDERMEGERGKVRFEQTSMGQLVLKAVMEKTAADVATMSSGGIRISLHPGEITYKNVLEVLPFGNTVTYVDVKGAFLKNYLATVANIKPGSGGYAQIANASFTLNGKEIGDIKIKGQPLDVNKTYRLAALSYNAEGGESFPPINQLMGYVDTGFVDADVVKEYIQTHSPLKAIDYQPKEVINIRQ